MDQYIEKLLQRYPVLTETAASIRAAAALMIECASRGKTIFTGGNGGSASDADHITGELLKGFVKKRPLPAAELEKFAAIDAPGAAELGKQLQMGIRAVNLGDAHALISAFGNDVNPHAALAQRLWTMGEQGDIFIAISTGGNAENIRLAMIAARVKKIKTILLTGSRHGVCRDYADVVVAVPAELTYQIQELHLPIYHALCMITEGALFNE